MSATDQVFAYCERGTDGAFWAEPVNAVTNFAFIAAGAAALVLARRETTGGRAADPVPALLALIVIVIGIGSFLFHTLATRWASLADVVPIGVFMLVYFAFAVSRYLSAGFPVAVVATVVFAGVIQGAQTVRCGEGPCLNGSLGYVPALAAMLGIGAVLRVRGHGAAQLVLAAGTVFALSLTLRTFDRALCDVIQPFGHRLGTHFLWHLLNASTLLLLLLAARRQPARVT